VVLVNGAVPRVFLGVEEGVSVDEFVIPRTLIAIALIIVVARLMGALFKRIRQPPVVGEIVGGILMGPTLLGLFPGDLDTELFPLAIRPFLKVIANVGLVIFMFIVGLELDMKLIRGKEKVAGIISISSIILPFSLGILLALGIYSDHEIVGGETVDRLPFALFMGAAMSITAFPVLARILTDRGMYRTQIGALTLACAAVDDVVAWSLLAIVLAVVDASGFGDFPRIVGLSVLFVAGMFLVVKPLLERLIGATWRKTGKLTPNVLATILVGILLASWATSEIGIHHIFGAFVFGAIMPRRDTHALFHDVLDRLEQMTVILLLPIFFVATGLNVRVNDLRAEQIGPLAAILVTAVVGKFVGATLAARSQRLPWTKAAAIGTLMNTRGLTELVILNIGREKGVLDDELFTMMVVMAVVTTVMTEPLLRIFYPDRLLQRDVADAARQALEAEAYRVVAVVDDDRTARELVEVAATIAGPWTEELPAEVVITRFTPFHSDTDLGEGLGLGRQLDEMASSMGELHDLAESGAARGAKVTVRSQFSDDPARDLVAQLEAIDADLVLVAVPAGGTSEFVAQVTRTAGCDIGVVHLGAGDRGVGLVSASVAGGTHGAAVAEIAARVAVADGVPVHLVDDRGRAGRRLGLVQRLLGRVDTPVITDPGAEGLEHHLVVGPPGAGIDERDGPWPIVLLATDHAEGAATVAAAGRTVVVVRGKEGGDDTRLEQFVATVREVDGERRLRAAAERDAARPSAAT
jgi:Kef-type K+ transport system membrane component KefB